MILFPASGQLQCASILHAMARIRRDNPPGSTTRRWNGQLLTLAAILKYFALNKIYPAMTVAQILVITLVGLVMGEAVGGRHALGLVFGAVAIYLILA